MNVVAVDVGTTSVRLAIINFSGEKFNEVQVLASTSKDISFMQDGVKFVQKSSEIWESVCFCCRECLRQSALRGCDINGIAFSATCSLVLCRGENGYDSGLGDIIMWMDHRAIDEAQSVNSSNSKALEQFGGICSPEFSLAKLMWLDENQVDSLDSAVGLFELPDWLVYKCIRGDASLCPRSLCSVVCKWGYGAEKGEHCDIIRSLRLGTKIGTKVYAPGTVAGQLCAKSAVELGLSSSSHNDNELSLVRKIFIGTSLIDAHSGMLAMLAAQNANHPELDFDIQSTLYSLAGTSTCHMSLSKERKFKRGIWGPYKNAILNDYYLLEAGQSMTGKLIDMVIESHHEGKQLLQAGKTVRDIIWCLNEQINKSASQSPLHILPTYHGNRSPLANPRLMGGVYGLSAEREASLRELYLATVESVVYETRFIVETLQTHLEAVLVSGGLMKNSLFMQTLADVLRCRVFKMALANIDLMVMGSGLVARQAILNCSASTQMESIIQGSDSAGSAGRALDEKDLDDMRYNQLEVQVFEPREHTFAYHDKKYACYLHFVEFSQRVDGILNKA